MAVGRYAAHIAAAIVVSVSVLLILFNPEATLSAPRANLGAAASIRFGSQVLGSFARVRLNAARAVAWAPYNRHRRRNRGEAGVAGADSSNSGHEASGESGGISTGHRLEAMVAKSKSDRLTHLEMQAKEALRFAFETFDNPVFPCALIAGDMVILDLLDQLGYLKSGGVKVMFVDTLYLFDETIVFMKETEERYRFKAHWFHAQGYESKSNVESHYGRDFWKNDTELYDILCKVEPFQRGLRTLEADTMITGRRRDHGFNRAFLDIYEQAAPIPKINALAYWTFEDVWDYINAEKIAYHPLHDKGYPSIGDAKDTIPVPREKWFEYAGERAGRFTGLQNQFGSQKTECGIHIVNGKVQRMQDATGARNEEEGNNMKQRNDTLISIDVL